MGEYIVVGQTITQEKKPPHLSAIEKIEAVLAGVNGSLTAKQKWEIFEFKILSLLDILNPAGLDAIIPTIEERLGIRRASILKEIKEIKELTNPEGKIKGGDSKPRERRAQSLVSGRLCYRTNLGWCGAGQGYVKEDKLQNPNPLYHLSTRGHVRLLDIGEGKEPHPKISEVYDKVVSVLTRHITWKNSHYPRVIGLWIMGTYFACIFTWYGYLWVTSPARRCGKSLLLELISYLAFNATPTLVNPRPAYLYRTVHKDFPTVVIDELSKFKRDGAEDYAEILSLLNAGAKNGQVVARMDKVSESFEATYWQAYCPKALAGLVCLPDTLNDRVLRVDMARKKRGEKIERLNLRKQGEELEILRDNLYLVGLEYDQVVIEFYSRMEELEVPEEVDDRGKDILEPLFALAGIIDAEKGNLDVTGNLKSYALELAGVRSADDHADLAQHTVRTLLKLNLTSTDGMKILTSKEALELFRGEPELEWCDTSQKAGHLLNRLGFSSYPCRVGTKQVRGYKLCYQDVQDLRERYLGGE